MADRNNLAGNGRRIYTNLNDFEPEVRTQEWEAMAREKPVTWMPRAQRGDPNYRRAFKTVHSNGLQEDAIRTPRTQGNKQVDNRGVQEEASHVPFVAQESDEQIRQAAVLLLARMGAYLTAELCDSCSATLHQRLAAIASGELLAAPSSGFSEPSAGTENSFMSGPITEGVANVLDWKDPQSSSSEIGADFVEEYTTVKAACAEIVPKTSRENKKYGERVWHESNGERLGSSARGSHDATYNLTKVASGTVGNNAPAYRTRSKSIQAGLHEIPASQQMTGFLSNNSECTMEVKRKKDYCLFERVNGQNVNILKGLELHTNVFTALEQKELIDFVYQLQNLGRNQKLRRRTYSEPRKWMRGKGRVTIQFGCCYNYAVDKDGNPPGIIREEEVDEIPPKFQMVIKRLVQWEVLPPSCIPDSCIVNIYDVGDCIPPHIDHHDFVRPFCTLSLLSECNIIFGTNLKTAGPGEFTGSISIPLPTGSVLILNGNGADVAKHAVPAVPTPRISITFRKMDPTKVPYTFNPDKELLSTQPLISRMSRSPPNSVDSSHQQRKTSETLQFSLESDFPALGRPGHSVRPQKLRT